jgi:hypothetical protein
VTFQDIEPEHTGYFASELSQWKSGNAIKARHSFSEFRQTIRPDMKWNWMTDIITNELQGFYNAFAAGKRPKLAIEMPPQHGKSWAAEDFIAWVAGKRPDWKTTFASYSDGLGTDRNRKAELKLTASDCATRRGIGSPTTSWHDLLKIVPR